MAQTLEIVAVFTLREYLIKSMASSLSTVHDDQISRMH
jgi:hypothetical protein